jgi:hypothetical protein
MNVLVLLNFLLVTTESISLVYLGDCFFQRRTKGLLVPLCVMAVTSNLICACFEQWIIVAKVLLILNYVVCLSCLFRTDFVKALFTALLLVSYLVILDSFVVWGVPMLLGTRTEQIYSDPYAYYLLCFGAKALELLGLVIFRACTRVRLQVQATGWEDCLRLLFYPTTTMVLSLALIRMYEQAPELAGTLSLCGCMLLLTDIMSIFLLEHLEKQQIAIRDNAILQQNLKSERDSIGIWVEAYRQERKRSHDFQNQLSVLRGMVEDQAPTDSFLGYLDSLLNVKLPATRYIDTGRPVADVLLSQKAAIAANKGIRFQMQLDNLSSFPLSDDALVVVLANLLDNAIEACEKIEEPAQRIIHLRMQAAPEAYFLYVDNPTAQPVQIVNNQVVSTKKNGLEHGYGLKNIAMILDQLDAIYAIDYQAEQHLFRFSAQFVPQK